MEQLFIGLLSTITTQLVKTSKKLPKLDKGNVAGLRYVATVTALLLAGFNAYLNGSLEAFLTGPTFQTALAGSLKLVVTVIAPQLWYILARKLKFDS